MKTTVFYSYKGGVGKSLVAANFAAFLSRLGKDAAILDFDFSAPSIHTKFSKVRASLRQEVTGGFLRYMMNCARVVNDPTAYPLTFQTQQELSDFLKAAYNSSRPENNSWHPEDVILFDAPPPLESQGAVVTLPPQGSKRGTLHVIPAGNIFAKGYWPLALGIPFRKITGFEYDRSAGTAGEIYYEDCRSFFAQIKQRIEELDPAPEYCIIDLQAGAHQLATSVLTHWADQIVCLFGNNDETLEYLGEILPSLSTQIAVFPVLSFAHGDINYANNRSLRNLLEKIGRKEEELSILHSDPDLRTQERLVIGYDEETVKNCQLSHDLVKLFARILGPTPTLADRTSSLREQIGLNPQKLVKEKSFRLRLDEGLLENPDDNSRNVAFKQQTFQLLLDGLRSEIDPNVFPKALHAAGEKCGFDFGSSLSQQWGGVERIRKEDYRGIQADIQAWCAFDSEMGLGRFKLGVSDESYLIKGRALLRCTIIVENNFLVSPSKSADSLAAKARAAGDHEHCPFMEGYVLGVFKGLFNDDYAVIHSGDSNAARCTFLISQAEIPPFA